MGRLAGSDCEWRREETSAEGHDGFVHAVRSAAHHVVNRNRRRCDEAHRSADAWRHIDVVSDGIGCLSADLRDLEVELGSKAGTETHKGIAGGGACLS